MTDPAWDDCPTDKALAARRARRKAAGARPGESIRDALARRAAAKYQQRLTSPHAVYRLYDQDGELLYIGCTARLGERLNAHNYTTGLLRKTAVIKIEWHPDGGSGLASESKAISAEHPLHNVKDA